MVRLGETMGIYCLMLQVASLLSLSSIGGCCYRVDSVIKVLNEKQKSKQVACGRRDQLKQTRHNKEEESVYSHVTPSPLGRFEQALTQIVEWRKISRLKSEKRISPVHNLISKSNAYKIATKKQLLYMLKYINYIGYKGNIETTH